MKLEDININISLLDRCRNGEPKAQFILYKQYSRAMYNIAIRFLNNQMDAEDILQESFVTAFEKLDELEEDSAFASWLKRIVINNCITHLRKRKINFDDIDDCESELFTADDEDLTVDPAIVHNAIKELPAGGRTILTLHVLEGYKHREIADMLGISESTSKSQYRRALEILFKNLKHTIYVS